jgi:hypothetical protein
MVCGRAEVTIVQPAYHGPLVNRDGTLSRPLVDLLQALALELNSDAGTDLTTVNARIAALEALRIGGQGGIRVYGSAASGFDVVYEGAAAETGYAQSFLLMGA